MPNDANDPRAAEIVKLDERRRAALIAADFAALDALLADDLIHVHGGGNVDTKEQYFALMKSLFEFVAIERRDLKVHFQGPVAVMTGGMTHVVKLKATGEIRSIDAFGTQIWVPAGESWRQWLYQATEIAPGH